MNFAGRTAVVTGGGSGIGRETALALGAAGANVIIGNRNEEQGESVAEEIRSTGGQAVFQQTNVVEPAEVKALIDRAVLEFGGLDLAFNNAGYGGHTGPLHEQELDRNSYMIDVNVKGVFYCMKYQIEAMLKRGGGAIVNNSSILGLKGTPNLSVYVSTKHAVAGMTKSAALDYAEQNIRINAVAPGPIRTPMLDGLTEGNPDVFAQFVPMGRIGETGEIARPVLWLMSDEASFITGHTMPIDGGWHGS